MLTICSRGRKTIVAGTMARPLRSMVATMLDKLGADPSFLIGGVVEGYDTNGKTATGHTLSAKRTSLDGSFMFPT